MATEKVLNLENLPTVESYFKKKNGLKNVSDSKPDELKGSRPV